MADLLTTNVIELQHDGIREATIDAGVFAQKGRDETPIDFSLPRSSLLKRRPERLTIIAIVCRVGAVLARPTIRL